jgi:ribosomal protein S12 methylthiotransferase accessory factor
VHTERGRPTDDLLPELTSTGLACHVSLSQAVLGGLCEVLERDALAVTWYNRLAPAHLNAEGTPVGDLMTRFYAEAGVLLQLFSLPTDGPFPVILAVARPGAGPPFAAVGVACRPRASLAAAKAVAEAGQVLVRLRAMGGDLDPDDDAAARYATAEGAQLLGRCLESTGETVAVPETDDGGEPSPSEDLVAAVAHLARNSLEVVVTELTTADVAAAGWRVVRVLVPGAVWPGTKQEWAPLSGSRLYKVPVQLNLRDAPLAEHQLRALPVPLA